MTWRGEIMGLPQSEQLPAALDMISDLLGGGTADRAHWRAVLGLAPAQALIFGMLWARPGQLVAVEAIFAAMDFEGYKATENCLRVQVSHLRTRLRRKGFPLAVTCRWGVGYVLAAEVVDAMRALAPNPAVRLARQHALGDLPAHLRTRQGAPWTDQDNADLRLMVAKGDAVAAIAYELDRSKGSILGRCAILDIHPAANPAGVAG